LSDFGGAEGQTPNQSEANWILIQAICQKNGPDTLQCIQQVEKSMRSRASREEALLDHPEAEPFKSSLRLTPALWQGGGRYFGDIQGLAAIG
jgi:hypothetical protein